MAALEQVNALNRIRMAGKPDHNGMPSGGQLQTRGRLSDKGVVHVNSRPVWLGELNRAESNAFRRALVLLRRLGKVQMLSLRLWVELAQHGQQVRGAEREPDAAHVFSNQFLRIDADGFTLKVH